MFSQITTVKGRREHVQKHLSRWLDTGIEELVLVDYACPDGTAEWVLNHPTYGRDPRITVVRVPRAARCGGELVQMAGDQFHLTRARNVGALAARHELLLFLDADCWVTPFWVEQRRRSAGPLGNDNSPDLWVSGPQACDDEMIKSKLPYNWSRDGQCLIRQPMFHRINGYNENHQEWGGESYDLYVRAVTAGARVAYFDSSGLFVTAHSDTDRSRFLRTPLKDCDNARELRYRRSLQSLQHQRRSERANPGREIGFAPKLASHLKLFRGGQQRAWRPGEDDVV